MIIKNKIIRIIDEYEDLASCIIHKVDDNKWEWDEMPIYNHDNWIEKRSGMTSKEYAGPGPAILITLLSTFHITL